MALTKLTADVENIQALSDTPNATEGLTADELKKKFDDAGIDIKSYINGTLTEEIDTEFNNINTSIDNIEVGWTPANETWTYVSVDDPTGVIKINADVTTKYSLGMRIKFTNATNVIYGILTKIGTYGGDLAGYTYLTFLHEIDPTDSLALHLMQNSAITNNYYSCMKIPFGFPVNPDKWSVMTKNTNYLTQSNPNENWYNIGNLQIIIPIGTWEILYSLALGGFKASTTSFSSDSTLSTSNNSESDKDFHGATYIEAATATLVLIGNVYKSKTISLTSKTPYYLLGTGNGNAVTFHGDKFPTIIRAVSAYL